MGMVWEAYEKGGTLLGVSGEIPDTENVPLPQETLKKLGGGGFPASASASLPTRQNA